MTFYKKKYDSRLRMCEIFTTVEGTDLALKKGSPTSKLRSRNAAHTTRVRQSDRIDRWPRQQ